MTVLVLSNQMDETANYLCGRMLDAGISHVRLDTEQTVQNCQFDASPSATGLVLNETRLFPEHVRAVWYRRPHPVNVEGGGDAGARRFAALEWSAALEGFLSCIPERLWISHPSRIQAATSKLEQLKRAASFGMSVPPWLCTTSSAAATAFCDQYEYVIAKPLYCGYVERENPADDTVIYTSRVAPDDLVAQGPKLGAPTLFQYEIRTGFDVRVTVVDDDLMAVKLTRAADKPDIRRINMEGVQYENIGLPADVQNGVLSLVRSYGLRFGAIDMMVADGKWSFLELNPNGQWAWLDLIGGAEIYKLFLSALRSVKTK